MECVCRMGGCLESAGKSLAVSSDDTCSLGIGAFEYDILLLLKIYRPRPAKFVLRLVRYPN